MNRRTGELVVLALVLAAFGLALAAPGFDVWGGGPIR